MEEKEIHLRDYYRVIKKRRFSVFTFFIVVLTLTVIGTLTATPIYKASTKVLLEKNEPDPLSNRYYYTPYDPEFLSTQNQIIKSFRVAQKVVKNLHLENNYEKFFPESDSQNSLKTTIKIWLQDIFSQLTELLNSSSPQKQTSFTTEKPFVETLAESISLGITVTPVKDSRVVDISYMSPNPVYSQLIINEVVKAYREELLEIKMSSSGYAIKWMQEKANEERDKLEAAEKALQKYMQDNDIVTVENRITVVPQKLAEFSSQLSKAEAKRKELEAIYGQITSLPNNLEGVESIPVIAANTTLQSLSDQIRKAEQTIIELSQKYGYKHPTMIRAKDELKGLQEKKKTEILRIIESTKKEYELTRSNEKNLTQLLTKTKSEALNLNEKFIQYEILKRDVETNNVLYESLIKKGKEQSATEQTQTVNVWVVEEASVPQFAAKPNKKLNIALGLLIGLFGGIGLAFLVEYLDNTIKSPEEAEEKLGLSVLGVVPLLDDKKKKIEEIVQNEPQSLIAESYKSLRTALMLSSANKPPQTILVTSMSPKDGKTSTAINLATTLSQSNKKVLLIDCDMRNPRVQRVFSLEASKGLSTYLAGASDMDIIAQINDISVIPAGPIPPNPSELLSSDTFVAMINNFKKEYDLIIFDSPPLLPVTDGLIISKIVDGTIIVARAGNTTYEMLNRGVKSLQDINSHTLGMVISAADVKRGQYYYYGYSSYYASEEK